MSDDITPALTPPQWEARTVDFEYWGEVKLHSDGSLTVRTIDPPAIFRAADRHRLAALALHGQDFGFTREDVRELWRISQLNQQIISDAVVLQNLAIRIAALLPPANADDPYE